MHPSNQSLLGIEDLWIEVQGIKTHILKSGQAGRPVILLHGGGIDSARLSWLPTLQLIGKERSVYAPDWPGFGASSNPAEQASMDFYIRYFACLLEELQVDKASLVGFSMGGGIALRFALENPDRVDRLVLVDPYGIQRKAPSHRLSYQLIRYSWITEWTYAAFKRSRWLTGLSMRSILRKKGSLTKELLDDVMEVLQRPRPWEAFTQFQQDEILPDQLRTVLVDRMGELKMPVLIFHGDRDSLVPMASVQEAVRINPDIRLVVLEGCGHWSQRDCPDEFHQILTSFL